ncbi:MAG: cyclic nucleotide-binding domain-containing protein [Verrucomicrobia bacterium]|nr:cyclic nucleotide-binding domain-containing protein [Verrucomicrobiota bacterium]
MEITVRKLALSENQIWSDVLAESLYNSESPLENELTTLDAESEYWISESHGRVYAGIELRTADVNAESNSFLAETIPNIPQAEEHLTSLFKRIAVRTNEASKNCFVLVPASDIEKAQALEHAGFRCVGFQPLRTLQAVREGVLYYGLSSEAPNAHRFPTPSDVRGVNELAEIAYNNLDCSPALPLNCNPAGCSICEELTLETVDPDVFTEARPEPAPNTADIFALRKSADASPQNNKTEFRILGFKENQAVCGIECSYKEKFRELSITDIFAYKTLFMGPLIEFMLNFARDQLNAVYVEINPLTTSPGLIKIAEQLGFVPVAFLPGIAKLKNTLIDGITMMKLNVGHPVEKTNTTSDAAQVVALINRTFEHDKVGVAMTNLLSELQIFKGLGAGETRNLAELFTQKLYREGERIFDAGDMGREAYVVMRGEIKIYFKTESKPLATLGVGKVFGEQAFLEGVPRIAGAVATKPTILLVVQRDQFNSLLQKEPHLGIVVMRNMALDLSNKLRQTDESFGLLP